MSTIPNQSKGDPGHADSGPEPKSSPIDRDGPRSLYLQVAEDIAMRIGREEGYKTRLPSEAKLAAHYQVSRITVQLALNHLKTKGLIFRQQGRGTFVARQWDEVKPAPIRGFAEILSAQGMEPEMELMDFGLVPAPEKVIETLALTTDVALFLRRRYRLDGTAVALTEVYYPPSFQSLISEQDARRYSSPQLMEQLVGLTLNKSHITVQVQSAPEHVARALDLPDGSALMVLGRVSYTDRDETCEQSTLFVRAGIAEFSVLAHEARTPAPDVMQIRVSSEKPPSFE